MAKVKMLVELNYDADGMHGDHEEAKRWFTETILLSKGSDELLILHSNEIGDTVGEVRVLEIIESESSVARDKA